MILTGLKIKKEVEKGNITIIPFNKSQINPNSYDYRLGNKLVVFKNKNKKEIIKLDKKGYVLKPGKIYLCSTKEILGSEKFAMRLIGKSSTGRLGLFLQISADLGHVKSSHKWTLELVACKKVKIYPGMIIGQITFWKINGKIPFTKEKYNKFNEPQTSLINTK